MHRRTRAILERAGWSPGRAVDTGVWEAELVADGFAPLHPVARRFLAEFGGLRIPDGGPGVTRARESVVLVPTECTGEGDRFAGWSAHVGRDIAPIGELAGGSCSWANLGIDAHGEIYAVIDGLSTFGRMPGGLDALLLGHMPVDLA